MQIEGQVQYIQELTEGLWYEVDKQVREWFACSVLIGISVIRTNNMLCDN